MSILSSLVSRRRACVLGAGRARPVSPLAPVMCSWNFCSFDMKSLATFAFNMFDKDGDGWLEKREVMQVPRACSCA